MSKRTERSDEPNPFDSRRTTRVAVFTPRNPGPVAGAPAPDDKDDAGQPPTNQDGD
jgi:hypothetical protein